MFLIAHIPPHGETSATCFQPETDGMTKSVIAEFSEEQNSLLRERFRTSVAHLLTHHLLLCKRRRSVPAFVECERKHAADQHWFDSCCPDGRPSTVWSAAFRSGTVLCFSSLSHVPGKRRFVGARSAVSSFIV